MVARSGSRLIAPLQEMGQCKMAQKEDILEQIVEEYLTHKGYFVRHNIKYRPRSFAQTQSDIDVIGYMPDGDGPEKVYVVNCKSWQAGFSFQSELTAAKSDVGRAKYRELTQSDWSEAFCAKVKQITGRDEFTYVLVPLLAALEMRRCGPTMIDSQRSSMEIPLRR